MKAKNIVGQKFGRLTVISREPNMISPNGSTRARWLCICDCGKTIVKDGQALKRQANPSCGCAKSEKISQIKLDNLIGQRFGRLTVVSRSDNKGRNTAWLCKCDCGNQTIVTHQNLKSGHTLSCGCYNVDLLKIRSTKHGMSKSRLYGIWCGIKDRCNNPQSDSYSNYGKRGIGICVEWDNDFNSFMEWSLNNGYLDNLTIDRIDNNKGYEPNNCRWTTSKEQGRNKRNNILIFYKGKRQNLSAWCEELNLNYDTVWARLRVSKMSVEDAFRK